VKRSKIRSRPADNHLTAAEWEAQFHLLLVRSGEQCEGRTPWCLAPNGSVRGMPRERISIQHRRAQGMGGTSLTETNDLANLLLLCGTGITGCHGWVEVGERGAAEARGLWVRHEHDKDGNPIPLTDYPLVLHSGRRVLLHPTAPLYLPHPDPWGIAHLTRPPPGAPP
jgi:hypothetical protein